MASFIFHIMYILVDVFIFYILQEINIGGKRFMDKTYSEKIVELKNIIQECEEKTFNGFSDSPNSCLLRKISYELEVLILQNEMNMHKQKESSKPSKH